MFRVRSLARIVLIAAAGVLLPVGLVALWADSTVYDSSAFANRSAALLDSPAVRHELALRLTEELVRSGNQEAVNYRPAMEFAVEAAIDTDTFRSIFRTAVRRTHEALLAGQGGRAGLNLSDSAAIITSTLQLRGGGTTTAQSAPLSASLTDVTDHLSDYRVFALHDLVASVALVALVGSAACAAGALACADDRRRAVRTLGWWVVADGAVLVVLVALTARVGGFFVGDPALAAAVPSAIETSMADLRAIGFGVAAYGLIVVAATAEIRHTPAWAWATLHGWVEGRRTRASGKVLLGVLATLASIVVFADPDFWIRFAVVAGALWLGYLGLCELLDVIRPSARATSGPSGHHGHTSHARRWWEALAVGAVIALVLGLVTGGTFVIARRAATRAVAGELRCNGRADLCDLRLDEVTLPGSHNSMSSALYPGWLFAEQVTTVKGQLDAGIRALFVDTHYGIPSSSRMPGPESPIILTDRASEVALSPTAGTDPEVAARATKVASGARLPAGAVRGIYLCHVYCELGAVPFATVMSEVRAFIDSHPHDVVVLMIEDATTPADTVAVIEHAGLAARAVALDPTEPLPTLRTLIESGRTLLVFAEQGGSGAPAWYQPAYQHWFQETLFKFHDVTELSCAANRGPADAPLFLVNHWLTTDPRDPAKAAAVNAPAVLGGRLEQCAATRGRVPNVVAVDFATSGRVVATVADLGDSLRRAARGPGPGGDASSTSTAAVPALVARARN